MFELNLPFVLLEQKFAAHATHDGHVPGKANAPPEEHGNLLENADNPRTSSARRASPTPGRDVRGVRWAVRKFRIDAESAGQQQSYMLHVCWADLHWTDHHIIQDERFTDLTQMDILVSRIRAWLRIQDRFAMFLQSVRVDPNEGDLFVSVWTSCERGQHLSAIVSDLPSCAWLQGVSFNLHSVPDASWACAELEQGQGRPVELMVKFAHTVRSRQKTRSTGGRGGGGCTLRMVEWHPNIAPIISILDGNFVLPHSSHMPNMLLDAWISQDAGLQQLAPRRRQEMFLIVSLQVAQGLEHLHSMSAVHLDIKPHNILVRTLRQDLQDPDAIKDRLHCLICDWDFSSRFEGLSMCKGGTPGYWSPEQVVPLSRTGSAKWQERKEMIRDKNFPISISAYWRDFCSDPPIQQQEPIGKLSDSWSWATTLLDMFGLLDTMRRSGFRRFLFHLKHVASSARCRGEVTRREETDEVEEIVELKHGVAEAMDLPSCEDDLSVRFDHFVGAEGAALAEMLVTCLNLKPSRRLSSAMIVQKVRMLVGIQRDKVPQEPLEILESSVLSLSPWADEASAESEQGAVKSAKGRHDSEDEEGTASFNPVAVMCSEIEQLYSKIAPSSTSSGDIWYVTWLLTRVLCRSKRLFEAEDVCVQTLGKLSEGKVPSDCLILAQSELAWILANQRRYEESLECCVRSLELLREVERGNFFFLFQQVRILTFIGILKENLGDTGAAIRWYREAISLKEHTGQMPPFLLGKLYLCIAGVYARAGLRSDAHESFVLARKTFIAAFGRQHLYIAELNNLLGSHFAEVEEFEAAQSWYEESLLIYLTWKPGELALAAQCRKMAEVLRRRNKLELALKYYKMSNEIRMRVLGKRHCAMGLFSLGQIHMLVGDSETALRHFIQAIECHSQAASKGVVKGELLDVAAAFYEMATIYEHKGQYDKAWELCQRAADRQCGRARGSRLQASAAQDLVENKIRALQERLKSRNSMWVKLLHGLKDWDPLWVPDEAAASCKVCRAEFGFLRRRHHCRMCGNVVCNSCSSHRPRGKRICSRCYEDGGGIYLSLSQGISEKPAGSMQEADMPSCSSTAREEGYLVPDFTAENHNSY